MAKAKKWTMEDLVKLIESNFHGLHDVTIVMKDKVLQCNESYDWDNITDDKPELQREWVNISETWRGDRPKPHELALIIHDVGMNIIENYWTDSFNFEGINIPSKEIDNYGKWFEISEQYKITCEHYNSWKLCIVID